MVEVAYNACFGGFSLSREAVLLAREISGNPTWGGPCIVGDTYEDGTAVPRDYGQIDDVERNNPVLIQVIKKLGKKANGTVAALQIAEVPKGSRYRIDEYDGSEIVMTVDDYDWEIA